MQFFIPAGIYADAIALTANTSKESGSDDFKDIAVREFKHYPMPTLGKTKIYSLINLKIFTQPNKND